MRRRSWDSRSRPGRTGAGLGHRALEHHRRAGTTHDGLIHRSVHVSPADLRPPGHVRGSGSCWPLVLCWPLVHLPGWRSSRTASGRPPPPGGGTRAQGRDAGQALPGCRSDVGDRGVRVAQQALVRALEPHGPPDVRGRRTAAELPRLLVTTHRGEEVVPSPAGVRGRQPDRLQHRTMAENDVGGEVPERPASSRRTSCRSRRPPRAGGGTLDVLDRVTEGDRS